MSNELPLPAEMPIPRRLMLAAAGAAVGGCATLSPMPRPASVDDWHEVRLPGKAATRYVLVDKLGRRAVAAVADKSASMWRKRVAGLRPQQVAFSWWVDRLIDGADLSRAESADAPVRVAFGFGGDVSRLSARTRMMYELAHALTGEEPPYATLMYVWANEAPVDSLIHNPRLDRIRKIVLDSGSTRLGGWRDHRRSLVEDFQRAFGEAPGPLTSIALMTDTDNTGSSAEAWYGPVTLT